MITIVSLLLLCIVLAIVEASLDIFLAIGPFLLVAWIIYRLFYYTKRRE